MALSEQDTHYWEPVPQVVERLAERWRGREVLEIGPGYRKFPAASHFVDWREIPNVPPENMTAIDVNREKLPFSDKQWDFVYCRHVLEDMPNPFHLIEEMSRVGKAGYIETPSPIAELVRGVDGGNFPWRGYRHHRWIVWDNDGELTFVPKFSIVEHLHFIDEEKSEQLLREGSRHWNTYFLWHGDIRCRHVECPHQFAMPEEYGWLLLMAKCYARAATDRFFGMPAALEQIQEERAEAAE